jgi:MFS superfamily sulfate permease-like transporter
VACLMSTKIRKATLGSDDDTQDTWGFALVRREVFAAVPFGLALIPTCLSSGLLAFSPFGPEYLAQGITLGFYAIIFGGICTALLATTAFIVYSPRTNLALIQATAATYFLGKPAFTNQPELVIAVMAGCVLLGGLFVVLFSLLGIARIIKYTPHPVMAGFINGAALAIAWSQIKPFLDFRGTQDGPLPFLINPTTLAFILLLAAFIFAVNSVSKKLPAPFVGLGVGVRSGHFAGKHDWYADSRDAAGASTFEHVVIRRRRSADLRLAGHDFHRACHRGDSDLRVAAGFQDGAESSRQAVRLRPQCGRGGHR